MPNAAGTVRPVIHPAVWLTAALLVLFSAAPLVAQDTTGDTASANISAADTLPRTAEEDAGGATRRRNLGDVVSLFGGSRTIESDQSVRDAVVIGGTLRVRGEVRGDAVVLGGSLILYEGSRVRGDVVVMGGSIRNRGGTIGGERVEKLRGGGGEVRVSPLARLGTGIAKILSTLALGLVLAGAGALLVFYGRRYLETVSDTVRASALRSGVVGLVSAFLILPAFVFLCLALVISIIGIPLLIVAVPLYWLAAVAAVGLGLLGAAHAIGERTVERREELLRYWNSYAYLFAGLGILVVPLIAAHLMGMTGFLGVVGYLIQLLGWLVIWAAATVGLGAVILSRAGSRRNFAYRPESDLFAGEAEGEQV
ncbi:MAG: hypothetical protein ACREKN_05085 [Longimicrobiaceae bacterium]